MLLNRTLVRCLWIVVIFLAFVGLAVAARRTLVLLYPQQTAVSRNPAAALDAHFAEHRALTLLHTLPGALFMLLGPLQFIKTLRTRHPRLHRWNGRIFLSASVVLGVSGLRMALGTTIGGWDEKSAILLFGSYFLLALAIALRHALKGDFTPHREWMIRGYAIGLAVAAIRPLMASWFAAAVIRGRVPEPHQFFGTAFWIGFTLTTLAAELWIRYTGSALNWRTASRYPSAPDRLSTPR